MTTITDRKSFVATTNEPHQVAGIYFYSLLDCLVDLSCRVAEDFFDRPHMYTSVDASGGGGGSVVQELAQLHARIGNDEKFPTATQRNQIYDGVFGAGEASGEADAGDFVRLRNELINASAAFSERVYDTGVAMLLERVRSAHRPFRQYLTGLLGDSLRWSSDDVLANVTEAVAYPILRSPGVGAVFGIASAPNTDWPYAADANGDKLIEAIGRQLPRPVDVGPSGATDVRPLTREGFSSLQRAGLRGADAIAAIIDFPDGGRDPALKTLITTCYVWGSALMALAQPSPTPEPVVGPAPTDIVPPPVP